MPAQHRLLVLQSVGLCECIPLQVRQRPTAGWNIFLSYQNNINNKRLALAEEALLHAHSTQEAQDAQARIDELEKKKKKIQEGEGGGAVGVATRLSWS